MLQKHTRIIVALAAFSMLFAASSCSKKYSNDDPLSPVYVPSIIVGNDNHFLYAFDPSNGNKNWEYHLPFAGNMVASPLLYNGMLYIGLNTTDTLYKFDAKSGKLYGKLAFAHKPNFVIKGTPVADGNLIFLPTVGSVGSIDTLYAIDTGTGAVAWKFGTGETMESSPTVYNGQVIFATANGKVFSVDRSAGTQNWVFNAGAGRKFSGPATSSPFVYVGCSDGNMYCLHDSDGTINWVYPTQGAINSSAVAYKGNCIFGSDDHRVYCVDTATGIARWIDSTADRVLSSPYVANQVIYIASNDFKLYAIDIITGNIKWQTATGGLIQSSPIVYGSNVYIGSEDKFMYALDTANGNVIWKANTNGIIETSPVIDNLTGQSFNTAVSGAVN